MEHSPKSTLKDELLAELAEWAGEISDISRELAGTPYSTEEERASYEQRAQRVEDLISRARGALIAEAGRENDELRPLRIHAERNEDFSEPAYLYEAFAFPPWESSVSGGFVGFSDESEEGAASEILALLDELGLKAPAGVYGTDGEPLDVPGVSAPSGQRLSEV